MVGNGACANVRSLAVPLGGCAKACVNFFWVRCARGGCKRSETELTLPFTSVAPGYTRNAKYSPQMHHFGRVHRLHMDELQTLQQCLEECRQQKSCFPFAETLAKIATWVHSVREDMQATDSSRGPVARD